MVSGAATENLEPGCYQSTNWNAYIWFPGDDATTGNIATLVVYDAAAGEWPDCGDAARKCDNNKDDDGDGRTDFGQDPGCSSRTDQSELGLTKCDNGADDDGDGRSDYKVEGSGDPGCTGPEDEDEANSDFKCRNGVDDDGDGRTDYPQDPGCTSPEDPDELGDHICDNGRDDDTDGKTDFKIIETGDPGCTGPEDEDETTSCCSDGERGYWNPTFGARVELFGAPDIDLFRYLPTLTYCFDGKTAETLTATDVGLVDDGLDTAALQALGFDVVYDSELGARPPVTVGNRASYAGGTFEVHFDFASLADRLKLKGYAERALTGAIASKLSKHVRLKDYTKFYAETQGLVDELRMDLLLGTDQAVRRSLGWLPDALLVRCREMVKDAVSAVVDKWQERVNAAMNSGALVSLSSKELSKRLVGHFVETIAAATRVEIREWQPLLEVVVSPSGQVSFQWLEGIKSPFLTVEELEGSTLVGAERLSESLRSLTKTVSRLSARRLARRNFVAVGAFQAPADGNLAGRLLVRDGTPSRARAAGRAKVPVLARATRQFKAGERSALKLRLTGRGKAFLRRFSGRKLRVAVTLSFTATSGARALRTKELVLRR